MSDVVPGRSAESCCLEEDELLLFARGELSPDAQAAAHVHLDTCGACHVVLAEALSADDALHETAHVPRSLTSSSFAPGRVLLDRFRVTRLLARGGMGEVYEAEDLTSGARVALKVIAPALSDQPRALVRLRTEVQLARRVVHPNVCRVLDLCPFDDGLFVTMELLEGPTLGAHVRQQGPIAPAEAVHLIAQMAAGLGAAHDAGVVHRDFKSDNVMLCAGRAVVLDFGLARSTLAEPDMPPITSQNAMLGTLAYLSPEQVAGQHAVSPTADIYALGVVTFEMMTGELPFTGDSPMAAALARLRSPAPAPSSRVAGVPEVFDRVVARCLEREPARRFAHVSEVAAALQRGVSS